MCRAAQWCKNGDKALVGGLGLGLLPLLIEKKSSEIDVVEINPDVINLVWKYIKTNNMVIIQNDIENYLSQTSKQYNYIFLDTWATADYLNLVYITKLKDKAKKILLPKGKVICWAESIMRKELKQEYERIAINYFKGLLPINKKLIWHLQQYPFFFNFYAWLTNYSLVEFRGIKNIEKEVNRQIGLEIKNFCTGYWKEEGFQKKLNKLFIK